MNSNPFYSKTKIINGKKSLGHIVNEMISLQSKRPLIISSISCKANISKIKKAFYNSEIVAVGTIFCDDTNENIDTDILNVTKAYNENNCDSYIVYGADYAVTVAKISRLLTSSNTTDIKSALKKSENETTPLFLITSGEIDMLDSSNIILYKDELFQSSSFFPDTTIIDSSVFVKIKKNCFDNLASMTLLQSAAILIADEISLLAKSMVETALNNILAIEYTKKYTDEARELLQIAVTSYQAALSNCKFSKTFSIATEIYKNTQTTFLSAQLLSLFSAFSIDLRYSNFNFESLPIAYFAPNEEHCCCDDDCDCGNDDNECNCDDEIDDFGKTKECFLNKIYDLEYFFSTVTDGFIYYPLTDDIKKVVLTNLKKQYKNVEKADFEYVLDYIFDKELEEEEEFDEN